MKHYDLASFGLGSALSTLVAIAVIACTPAQRATAAAIEPGVDSAIRAGTCLVLRATGAGGQELCATADELAPFVDELVRQILTQRAAAPISSTSSALVAMSLPPPKRSAPKRHCAQWVPASGSSDAGTDAAP